MSLVIGMTTTKYMDAATIRNERTALMNVPYVKTLSRTVNVNPEKSGTLMMAAMSGVMMSFTSEFTKAADSHVNDVSAHDELLKPCLHMSLMVRRRASRGFPLEAATAD